MLYTLKVVFLCSVVIGGDLPDKEPQYEWKKYEYKIEAAPELFAMWQAHYNVTYPNEKERAHRASVFKANLVAVNDMIASKRLAWPTALHPYSDRTSEEIKHMPRTFKSRRAPCLSGAKVMEMDRPQG